MSGTIGDNVYRASGVIAAAAGGGGGAIDWQTDSIKVTGDSPVTGVAGEGYFMNTTAGAITLNLPVGVAGEQIAVMDYAETFATNNCTLSPNGSEKIGSLNIDVPLATAGMALTMIYVDSTQGWLNIDDATLNVRASAFVEATVSGSCNEILTDGDYKVAKFVNPGTFCVSSVAACASDNEADWLVLAGGGGGGGSSHSAGAGAGGQRESPGCATCYTASPLGAAPMAAKTLTIACFPIAVGAGGAGGGPGGCGPGSPPGMGANGSNSCGFCFTSAGGGAGTNCGGVPGEDGGSGGGTGAYTPGFGAGNTPPTNPSQGNPGGTGASSPYYGGGGGGGSGQAGQPASATPGNNGGPGGNGVASGITGASVTRGGGGGAAGFPGPGGIVGTGGTGGGGDGTPGDETACAGTAQLGGGGGGASQDTGPRLGGAGGSGIVFIRYKFQ